MSQRGTRIRALSAGIGIGLGLGLPLGWLASEVRRGWRTGSEPPLPDEPPFAPELASAPRQPGEWL